MDMKEFLQMVAREIFEKENAVLNILMTSDMTEIQLIPKDLWEGREA